MTCGVRAIVVSDEHDAESRARRRLHRHPGRPAVRRARRRHRRLRGACRVPARVLSLQGEVIAVKHVAAGAGVSYGYTHRTADADHPRPRRPRLRRRRAAPRLESRAGARSRDARIPSSAASRWTSSSSTAGIRHRRSARPRCCSAIRRGVNRPPPSGANGPNAHPLALARGARPPRHPGGAMSARLEIHLDAIRQNVARARGDSPSPARTMFAVKADAYGLGMLPVARAGLEGGADSLAVLDVPAALALRAAGIDVPLFAWLHGVDTDFRAAIDADVDLGVSSLVELSRIASAAGRSSCPGAPQDRHRLAPQRSRARRPGRPSSLERAPARRRRRPHRGPVVASRRRLPRGRRRSPRGVPGRASRSPRRSACRPRDPTDRCCTSPRARPGIRDARGHDSTWCGSGSPPTASRRSTTSTVPASACAAPSPCTREVIALGDGIAVLDVGSADGLPPSVLGPSGSGAEVQLAGTRARVIAVDVDTLTVGSPRAPRSRLGDEALVYGPGDARRALRRGLGVVGRHDRRRDPRAGLAAHPPRLPGRRRGLNRGSDSRPSTTGAKRRSADAADDAERGRLVTLTDGVVLEDAHGASRRRA